MIKLFGVVPVEHEDAALIGGKIRRRGAIDKEAYRRSVRIDLASGQYDGILRGVFRTVRRVGEKALVGIGPQVKIEPVAPLFGSGLDDHLPAALQRALEKGGKRLLKRGFGQVIEKNLGHDIHMGL